jgi:hypothetical protein
MALAGSGLVNQTPILLDRNPDPRTLTMRSDTVARSLVPQRIQAAVWSISSIQTITFELDLR